MKKNGVIIFILILLLVLVIGYMIITKDKSPNREENSAGTKIKSFNEVEREYGMTPAELEEAIQSGMSPQDLKK